MAYNLGIITSKVGARIRDSGYAAGEIINYINDTQNDVFNEYRLSFMQTTQNYTLATNTSDITNGSNLPTNYVQALDLSLTTAGREKILTYRDIREIESLYPDPDDTTRHPANVPNDWYFYAGIIRVFPVPNSAYTVTLRYYKKPTILVDSVDVPEIPSEFEELLVVGAAYRIMQIKDNYDQAGILENKYGELLQKLAVKYSVLQVGKPTVMRINRHAMGQARF